MKRILLLAALLLGIFQIGLGQPSIADTVTVRRLASLARRYAETEPSQARDYARRGLLLATRLNDRYGQSECLGVLGYERFVEGDFVQAFSLILKAHHLAEQQGWPVLRARHLNSLCQVYTQEDSYELALASGHEARVLATQAHNDTIASYVLMNLGAVHYSLNRPDSARLYGQRAYALATRLHYTTYLYRMLLNLGNGELAQNHPAAAYAYYRQAAAQVRNERGRGQTYLALAQFFQRTGRPDSSLYYGRRAATAMQQANSRVGELAASRLLAADFTQAQRPDSALRYADQVIALTDTLFNARKTERLANLSFQDQLDDQALVQARKAAVEKHHDDVQLAAIAVFIPAFLVLVLLLGRLRVPPRVVEFLGVLSLLLLFEFVQLLIEPQTEPYTHDAPALGLLVQVGLALLLTPPHHRLTQWLKARLSPPGTPVLAGGADED